MLTRLKSADRTPNMHFDFVIFIIFITMKIDFEIQLGPATKRENILTRIEK